MVWEEVPMSVPKSVRVLAGLVCLLLWSVYAIAQQEDWERRMRAGVAAYQQGDYAEAVKQTRAALTVAEAFGPDDLRLVVCGNTSVIAEGDVFANAMTWINECANKRRSEIQRYGKQACNVLIPNSTMRPPFTLR